MAYQNDHLFDTYKHRGGKKGRNRFVLSYNRCLRLVHRQSDNLGSWYLCCLVIIALLPQPPATIALLPRPLVTIALRLLVTIVPLPRHPIIIVVLLLARPLVPLVPAMGSRTPQLPLLSLRNSNLFRTATG